MNPDNKRKAFALGAAAAAMLLAWGWLHWQERVLLRKGEPIKVLAAKRYLPAYTRIKASDLAWFELPRAYAPTGVVMDADSVVGQQTLVPFSAEEPLLYNKLALGEQSLAAAIPEGRRALSVGVSEVSGLSGLLKAGDRVDLFLLHGSGAALAAGLLLQDVPVLAVGGQLTRADKDGAHNAATVTLALTPDEVSLALPASNAGQIHLALRASGDERPASATHAGFSDALRRLDRSPGSSARATAPQTDEAIPHKR